MVVEKSKAGEGAQLEYPGTTIKLHTDEDFVRFLVSYPLRFTNKQETSFLPSFTLSKSIACIHSYMAPVLLTGFIPAFQNFRTRKVKNF